jgi:hypothetical protein
MDSRCCWEECGFAPEPNSPRRLKDTDTHMFMNIMRICLTAVAGYIEDEPVLNQSYYNNRYSTVLANGCLVYNYYSAVQYLVKWDVDVRQQTAQAVDDG